jgi:hypothetical protein
MLMLQTSKNLLIEELVFSCFLSERLQNFRRIFDFEILFLGRSFSLFPYNNFFGSAPQTLIFFLIVSGIRNKKIKTDNSYTRY